MGPHEVTLTYHEIGWLIGTVFVGATSWALVRFQIRRNLEKQQEHDRQEEERIREQNQRIAKADNKAQRANDRLDDFERAQIRVNAMREAKESELFRTLESVDRRLEAQDKKLDHLMTKGCAIGCKPSQGEMIK